MTVTAAHPTKSSRDARDEGVISGTASEVDTKVLLDAIEAIASFVAGFQPSRYSGDDAATLVSSFTRAEHLCSAGKTLAAKRVAESNRHVASGHRSAAEWLARQTGASMGEAIDLLALGEALEFQPGVEEAYRGESSPRPGPSSSQMRSRSTPDVKTNCSVGRKRTPCDS